MPVNSVSPAADAYAERKRQLQEERDQELARIESSHQAEIAKAEEARGKELKQIYENQQVMVDDRRAEADARVTQAKAAADARIRQFEEESARMTEEARRQFQAKAELLDRNARELAESRKRLVARHDQAMHRIREDNEDREAQTRAGNARASANAYLAAQRGIKEVEEHGTQAMDEIRASYDDRKRIASAQGEHELANILQERERNKAVVEAEVGSARREADTQVEHERAKHDARLEDLAAKYDARNRKLAHEMEQAVNRAHIEGGKKLKEAQDFYHSEMEEARHDKAAKMRDMTLTAEAKMHEMAERHKTEEFLATSAFNLKRKALEGERSRMVLEQSAKNEELQQRLNEDFATRSKELSGKQDTALKAQNAEIQREMAESRKMADRELNETKTRLAKAVSDHEIRSDDPFYRVHALYAHVEDRPGEYLVTVEVPKHEMDNIRVTMQKGQLTVSGSRRYEDTMRLESGHRVGSHAYQTYSESFPISGPPNMSAIQRSYEDGWLTFRIPKA